MAIVTDSARIAAEAGAGLLDERRPGWDERANERLLNVQNPWACPLAQEYGSYRRGIDDLFHGSRTGDQAVRHGFEQDHEEHSYAELTAAWKQLLRDRRRARRDAGDLVGVMAP